MPKLSGKDVVSESTEKIARRTLVVGSATALAKLYDIPLNEINLFGMKLPASLFDTACLFLVCYGIYSLLLNWLGDLAAFRLWFRESSIWSEFGTSMKVDREFIRGGIPLLLKLHALEQKKEWPDSFDSASDEVRQKYVDFRTNVELYCVRLENAGTRFSLLSLYAHFYVWFQSFLLPVGVSLLAAYLLVKYGTFIPPARQ